MSNFFKTWKCSHGKTLKAIFLQCELISNKQTVKSFSALVKAAQKRIERIEAELIKQGGDGHEGSTCD